MTPQKEQALNEVYKLQRLVDEKTADLEHKNRQLKIESALENVRSRSLAMHHSDELQHVVAVMYEQLSKLGFNKNEDVVSINLFDDDTGDMLSWAAGTDGAVPFCLTTPNNEYSIYTNIWEARANGEDFFSKVYSREEKNAFWGYLFAQNNYAQLPQDDKDTVMQGEGYAYDIAIAKHACIMYLNFHGRLTLNDEQKEILKRFVNVFEQAYIRFLDLQKAEAQTKEAQIEAALERVRSRSMGMQKSEELREVIQLILDQLCGLQFNIHSASFAVDLQESNDLRVWAAAPGQQYASRINLPYIDHPIYNRYVQAKEKGEDFYTLTCTKEEKNRFFDHFFKYAPVPEERRNLVYSASSWSQASMLMKTVALNIQNYAGISYSEEQNNTLKRFGKVFEQTYTRFLDLQNAETQAREAQIETALERVRSRSMGMRKSDELREVIQLILDELCGLHFNIHSASFAVELHESNDLRVWLAAPGQQYASRITLPYIDHPLFNGFVQAKEKRKDFYTQTLSKEEKNAFFDHFLKYVPVTEERRQVFYKANGWALSSMVMETLALNIQNYDGLPYSEEQNNTLKRFGRVFEQTYTRFLDLQKAEASAKEAVRQASVDRVRAEIASMRTASDLERITPLIWKELSILNVPFTRCGVFILSDEEQLASVYLSTPEGKALAAFKLPINNAEFIDGVLNHWRKNQLFLDHWDAQKFTAWTKSLVDADLVKINEKYNVEKPPENLYLHFIPFQQGMLYVGYTTPLQQDEISLVQSLANAFSTAYARYDDFTKLESAKRQIENTLSELKSTQAQLIQKEKMASLGELTAGIAHEIQNPLNFINNFSEVSSELCCELKDELFANNPEEAKIITEYLIQNLEKILHHGHRADSIVKGMLQHSRVSSGTKQLTDINALADEYLRLSYHGLRAKDKAFNASLITDFDNSIGQIEVAPQELGRVLLNLFDNAFYATQLKKNQLNGQYQPEVRITTRSLDGKVEIRVKDNGSGIPEGIKSKIFQPFFTTKPTGQGTGLGLSLSYDIITKGHGGELRVETKEEQFSEFIIKLPLKIKETFNQN